MSLNGIYGGLETIKSYFPTFNLHISKTLNFDRWSKLRFFEFVWAILIAFAETSIPTPFEKFNSNLKKLGIKTYGKSN